MPITINMRHLEDHSVNIEGRLPVEELDIETQDEVIHVGEPLEYDLTVEKMDDGLLVRGGLSLPLQCECVRCLKPFIYDLNLPDFHVHVPLEGEDAAPFLNDFVDLTPHIREDILLEFPQHPLCDPECRGLPPKSDGGANNAKSSDQPELGSSAWAELNKLKFKN